ncbi:hypothetical protein BJ165DRAFT_1535545 [Panaeolus papilionaceus]|nr:hypothetical protein BJ165DRAFT_1535545 [Panaeolus papilionaceus]
MPAATGATESAAADDFVLQTSQGTRTQSDAASASGGSSTHLTPSQAVNPEEVNAWGHYSWKRILRFGFNIFNILCLVIAPLQQWLFTASRAFHAHESLGFTWPSKSASGEYKSPSDHPVNRILDRESPDQSSTRHRHTELLHSPPYDIDHANGLPPYMNWQHNPDSVRFSSSIQPQPGFYQPIITGYHHPDATNDSTAADMQRATIISRSDLSDGSVALPKPSARWSIATSWRLQDPSRVAIPRAFLSYPKERHDLLSVQQYKTLQKEKLLALQQQISEADHLFNTCMKEETELLLAIDARGHDWNNLDSKLALAVARAARKTSDAQKHFASIKVVHAQALLQQLLDEAEEALSFTEEANHQIMPIINAFKECGWTIDDITAHCGHIVDHYLSTSKPLTLADMNQERSSEPSEADLPNHSPASKSEGRSYYSKPDSG